MEENKRQIVFRFHPYEYETLGNTLTKSEKGAKGEKKKRMYLRGISSGLMKDGQGERMTPNCIKSMHKQASSGDIVLHAGKHGKDFQDDIGILTASSVTKDGDWLTEYRLYDELDEPVVGTQTVQTAKKVWAKLNGIFPYTKRAQKGFSIEGIYYDRDIIGGEKQADGSVTGRVINDIQLDHVVLVNRPAYGDSVATSIYKSLGEYMPEQRETIKKGLMDSFSKKIQDREKEDSYYKSMYTLNGTLEDEIVNIMRMKDDRKALRLEMLFDEYKTAAIPLIMQYAQIFRMDDSQDGEEGIDTPSVAEVLKSITATVKELTVAFGGIKWKKQT